VNAVAVTVQIIGMLGLTALLFVVGNRPKGRQAYECVDLRRCDLTNLPSVRMLQLGLRVSDLEQSLALYARSVTPSSAVFPRQSSAA
jgi:hypothetical protein